MVNCLPTMQETWVRSLGWKILWRRKWEPSPVLLPGRSHGWRRVVDYSPWGRKESDTTERPHFHFNAYIYICNIGFSGGTVVKICLPMHIPLLHIS